MNDASPELRDPADLPGRVLCFATVAGDEALGCGELLDFHRGRGDAVRVVVLAGGGEAASPGATDRRSLELEAGRVGAVPRLVERLSAELAEYAPTLVYAPAAEEPDADRRAAARACAAALAGGSHREVLLYGVGRRLGDVAFDTRSGAAGGPAGERFWATTSEGVLRAVADGSAEGDEPDPFAATAVISNWNKAGDLRENLAALRAQTRPFREVVVVDNASSDGSSAMVASEFPEVCLVVMPHSRFGACETFNIGFERARSPLIAILDDDVVLPPEWLERCVARLRAEPPTTAVISTEVIEPGMPEAFVRSAGVAQERYMSTFRGCASLARAAALREAGGYDERLFIYGNERDLTCRLLNLGYRVLHYPAVRAFHKTPFGIKLGKRSLYYHARNAWLMMIKYAPLGALATLPWLVVSRVLLRPAGREAAGEVSDATGTIGIGRSVRETPGAWWVLLRACGSVLYNLPYCLRHRHPVRAGDFELPLK